MDHQGTRRFVPVETGAPRYGSDLIAAAIREQGFPYICLNPGASYRHLHDSLVNYLGNEKPKILLCMHEEHAIGIAQGWAKITDRPLAAAVHSNVGLMHATMGIFDAWCDRVPVVVIGATGPLDATKRRPWIEWIHCTIDQGGLVRDFTKWDDEPASPEAAVESIRRATMLATARPSGPTYVNLDVTVQEMELEKVPALHDISRFRAPADSEPPRRELEEAIEILAKAKRPVILSGRTSRSEQGWAERVKLAELLGAKVLTHVKLATSFPTTHPLFVGGLEAFQEPAQAPQRSRRRAVSRLARPRRHDQPGLPGRRHECADHQRVERLQHPSRLEHGLSGPAGGRRQHSDRAGNGRLAASGGARNPPARAKDL
ncbi:thiamine pyrophosphate-binding protein [Sinorhizobium fredii]|uniref:thiamine pyrophosphate-binding protein n=1 Tax=Rhizobium fredii TaxID=380 RepID=UPI003514DAE8